MATIFGQNAKTKTVIRLEDPDSPGIDASKIVNIPGFTPDGSNAFLIDFSTALQERFGLMPCFGNQTYVFAYGHDIGVSRSTCTIIVFLSSCSVLDARSTVTTLASHYAANRLSKNGNKQVFSICGSGDFSSGLLIGMQIKAYSAELNAVAITLTYAPTAPASSGS